MIIVGSLKFSPVYKTHCLAFAKACEAQGIEVEYLFSKEYEWMLPEDILSKSHLINTSPSMISILKDSLNPNITSTIRSILELKQPSHVYLHNYHILNHLVAKVTRKRGGKFIYHVHEPFVIDKRLHGGFQRYWLYVFEALQDMLLKSTDVAILSSTEAEKLFALRYSTYSGITMHIPLMYEDFGSDLLSETNRRYLTFVGPPVPAKGPEKFLDIVRYSEEKNMGFEFQVISREPLKNPEYQRRNVKIISKRRISDEEYGKKIQESIAVITPYRRETQSSVVLVSCMYGTPILSSNVGGLNESVKHLETGYVLPYDNSTEDWIAGIDYIVLNFNRLSYNCRNFFLKNFSGVQWSNYLPELLK